MYDSPVLFDLKRRQVNRGASGPETTGRKFSRDSSKDEDGMVKVVAVPSPRKDGSSALASVEAKVASETPTIAYSVNGTLKAEGNLEVDAHPLHENGYRYVVQFPVPSLIHHFRFEFNTTTTTRAASSEAPAHDASLNTTPETEEEPEDDNISVMLSYVYKGHVSRPEMKVMDREHTTIEGVGFEDTDETDSDEEEEEEDDDDDEEEEGIGETNTQNTQDHRHGFRKGAVDDMEAIVSHAADLMSAQWIDEATLITQHDLADEFGKEADGFDGDVDEDSTIVTATGNPRASLDEPPHGSDDRPPRPAPKPTPRATHGSMPTDSSTTTTTTTTTIQYLIQAMGMAEKIIIIFQSSHTPSWLAKNIQRITITGYPITKAPESKQSMSLLNMSNYFEAKQPLLRTEAIRCLILCGLAFKLNHKYMQSVELITKAGSLIYDEYQGIVDLDLKARKLLMLAKLEILKAEIYFTNSKEHEAIPFLLRSSHLFCLYRRLLDSAGKKNVDAREDSIAFVRDLYTLPTFSTSTDATSSQHAKSFHLPPHIHLFSDIQEIVVYCKDPLLVIYTLCLRDPCEYFKATGIHGLQYLMDLAGANLGDTLVAMMHVVIRNYVDCLGAIQGRPTKQQKPTSLDENTDSEAETEHPNASSIDNLTTTLRHHLKLWADESQETTMDHATNTQDSFISRKTFDVLEASSVSEDLPHGQYGAERSSMSSLPLTVSCNTSFVPTSMQTVGLGQILIVLDAYVKIAADLHPSLIVCLVERFIMPCLKQYESNKEILVQMYRLYCWTMYYYPCTGALVDVAFLEHVLDKIVSESDVIVQRAAAKAWSSFVQSLGGKLCGSNLSLLIPWLTKQLRLVSDDCSMARSLPVQGPPNDDESPLLRGPDALSSSSSLFASMTAHGLQNAMMQQDFTNTHAEEERCNRLKQKLSLLVDLLSRILLDLGKNPDDHDVDLEKLLDLSQLLIQLFQHEIVQSQLVMLSSLWESFQLIANLIPEECKDALEEMIRDMIKQICNIASFSVPSRMAMRTLRLTLQSLVPNAALHNVIKASLPSMLKRLPHSIEDDVFYNVREMLLLNARQLDKATWQDVIDSICDRFTVRANGYFSLKRTLVVLALTHHVAGDGSTASGSVGFRYFDWCMDICLLQNNPPSLDMESIHTDRKQLHCDHDMFLEKLEFLHAIMSSLQYYHVPTLMTRWEAIHERCLTLLTYPDLKACRVTLTIVWHIVEIIRVFLLASIHDIPTSEKPKELVIMNKVVSHRQIAQVLQSAMAIGIRTAKRTVFHSAILNQSLRLLQHVIHKVDCMYVMNVLNDFWGCTRTAEFWNVMITLLTQSNRSVYKRCMTIVETIFEKIMKFPLSYFDDTEQDIGTKYTLPIHRFIHLALVANTWPMTLLGLKCLFIKLYALRRVKKESGKEFSSELEAEMSQEKVLVEQLLLSSTGKIRRILKEIKVIQVDMDQTYLPTDMRAEVSRIFDCIIEYPFEPESKVDPSSHPFLMRQVLVLQESMIEGECQESKSAAESKKGSTHEREDVAFDPPKVDGSQRGIPKSNDEIISHAPSPVTKSTAAEDSKKEAKATSEEPESSMTKETDDGLFPQAFSSSPPILPLLAESIELLNRNSTKSFSLRHHPHRHPSYKDLDANDIHPPEIVSFNFPEIDKKPVGATVLKDFVTDKQLFYVITVFRKNEVKSTIDPMYYDVRVEAESPTQSEDDDDLGIIDIEEEDSDGMEGSIFPEMKLKGKPRPRSRLHRVF